MPTSNLWIVIADASRSRILQREKLNGPLVEVEGSRVEQQVPRSSEIGDDRPGRTMVSGGAVRHAYSPRTDPHREAKRDFINDLARRLDEDLAAGLFDKLILIAPPQALGDLREALSAPVASRVVGELHKDLTKVPDHEIPTHLAGIE
jgi:protein required for attachment to host cells